MRWLVGSEGGGGFGDVVCGGSWVWEFVVRLGYSYGGLWDVRGAFVAPDGCIHGWFSMGWA